MSKIQTWKRITTAAALYGYYLLLYLICQRYKLESESQPVLYLSQWNFAVFNMSKIQTWKRITTKMSICTTTLPLYLICQRYKLESESQLPAGWRLTVFAVFNMSKIQTWKRITTWLPRHRTLRRLYLICQRYKLESESQPINLS